MKRSAHISAALLLVVVLLTTCRPQEARRPPDQVTVQLKWVHQAQFAGFYLAQERGYYAEEVIEATFVEGGPGIDIVGQVITGGGRFRSGHARGIVPTPQPGRAHRRHRRHLPAQSSGVCGPPGIRH